MLNLDITRESLMYLVKIKAMKSTSREDFYFVQTITWPLTAMYRSNPSTILFLFYSHPSPLYLSIYLFLSLSLSFFLFPSLLLHVPVFSYFQKRSCPRILNYFPSSEFERVHGAVSQIVVGEFFPLFSSLV